MKIDGPYPSFGSSGIYQWILFQEKPGLRQLNRKVADSYQIPSCDFENIKAGNDYVLEDGTVVSNGIDPRS